MSDWVDEDVTSDARSLRLDAKGLDASTGDRRIRATWEQVFGIALVPEDAPRQAFVLVPRRPPQPPWIEILPKDLPEELREEGLEGLARRVRERMAQRGYRSGGPTRPLLDPATLMQRVLAREEVPGALEVPVGAGPGGWWRRFLDVFAAGSAGGLAGLYAGAFSGNPMIALGVAAAGATVGASVPVALSSSFESLRARRRRPRVLVLAPDGCVVGLTSGPAVFAWGDIARFAVEDHAPEGRASPLRACLAVRKANGEVASLDGAWFAEPLPLIVAVAEAYRLRNTPR
ncbi:MAG: hypothetical protein H6721_20355 [Sandaracinus sp.]|nr:hypothetical protein [Myxococcales bacterium]MCB9615503.1 hypothetical protein [Sandaracinus sp.]MCB9634482.1 hypothetical protein [Sandaracinus sp.]